MKNLYQKINQVMLEVELVEKGATVSMGNSGSYKAVSHDDVTRLLHLPVARSGIVLSPSVIESLIERESFVDNYGKEKTQFVAKVMVELTAINADNPDERLSVKMPAVAFDQGDKASGKAISMATKYCYLKLFMLESVDEEEQRQEQAYHPPKDTRKFPPEPKKQSFKLEPAIERLRKELSAKTAGKTPEEKAAFLKDKLNIDAFSELSGKKESELELMIDKLK